MANHDSVAGGFEAVYLSDGPERGLYFVTLNSLVKVEYNYGILGFSLTERLQKLRFIRRYGL